MALSIIFWAVLAAYIVHILDETLMGGGFVQKVREHWWSIRYKEYSPGLLSGVLFWILTYFLIRCGLIPGLITRSDFLIGLITGCAGGFLLSILPTRIMPRISRRK